MVQSRTLRIVLWIDVVYFIVLGALMILAPQFVNTAFKVPTYSAVDLRALGSALFGWGALSYVVLSEPQASRRFLRVSAGVRVLAALILLAAATILGEAPLSSFIVPVVVVGGLGILEWRLG